MYFILLGIASILMLMGGAIVDRLRAIEHELAETRHLHAIRALWQTGACNAGWWESVGAPQIEKMAGCDPSPVVVASSAPSVAAAPASAPVTHNGECRCVCHVHGEPYRGAFGYHQRTACGGSCLCACHAIASR